jgi:DNA-binding MarR family transcriptional regulator
MRTNLLDAYRKGRKTQPRSKHVNAKLTPAQVRTIRARYVRGGVRQVDLAAEFGVTQRVISLIIRHESYKDV